jgi:hypothetical protein
MQLPADDPADRDECETVFWAPDADGIAGVIYDKCNGQAFIETDLVIDIANAR